MPIISKVGQPGGSQFGVQPGAVIAPATPAAPGDAGVPTTPVVPSQLMGPATGSVSRGIGPGGSGPPGQMRFNKGGPVNYTKGTGPINIGSWTAPTKTKRA